MAEDGIGPSIGKLPRQTQLQAVLLLECCLAAEAEVGRSSSGGQLLAWVGGTDLAVAAAGAHLLLLHGTSAAVLPVAPLLQCTASITAVAVSSGCGSSGGSSSSSSRPNQWASALAGSTAHVVPVRDAPDAASSSAVCSFETAAGLWQACAWHPSRAVCALATAQQLLLVSPTTSTCIVGSGSSSSSAPSADMADGTEGGNSSSCSSGVLATVPAPARAGGLAGRCCVAWVQGHASSAGKSGSGGRGGGCWGRLVVSRGTHMELLSFGIGWRLLERRQLLPGLPGTVCGLAAAGSQRLLVTTERRLGQWLSFSEHQQQQEAEEHKAAPQVLMRGLQVAQQRQQPELALLLPSAHGGAGGSGVCSDALLLQQLPAAAAPLAALVAAERANRVPLLSPAGENGVIDLTCQFNRSASSPSVPAGLLLPLAVGQRDSRGHMPLEAGLPALPLAGQQQHAGASGQPAEGGQATLLWLNGGAAGGSSSSAGFKDSCDSAAAEAPAAAAAQPLPFAPGLLEVSGSTALLASSTSATPAVALCTCGAHELQALSAAVPLPVPSSLQQDCVVRIRGLALAAGGSSSGSRDSGGGAASEGAGAGNSPAGQPVVWALLSAAPKAAAAPFLGASLAGSVRQQLWLCCYRLEQLPEEGAAAQAHGNAAAAIPAAVQAGAERAEAVHGGVTEPAAARLLHMPAAAAAEARAPAAALGPGISAAPGSAATAVRALQGEVAEMRRDMNERLDGLSAQLGQLLHALQPQ